MKALLKSLAIYLIACSLYAQADLTPIVKTIDGQRYFCYNREQAESLFVKLKLLKVQEEELIVAHDLLKQYEWNIAMRDLLAGHDKDLMGLYKEQIEDYKILMKNERSWWDRRELWLLTGAGIMYLAVRAAAGIGN